MKIRWFAPEKIFTHFKDPIDNPSFRLRCFNIHQKLVEDGFDSKIINNIKNLDDPDILILMSFGNDEYDITRKVKSNGGFVLHDYCENIRGLDILEKTKKLCDLIICSSTLLGEYESEQYPSKIKIIKDPIETKPFIKNWYAESNSVKAVYLGMGTNAELFRGILKPLVEDLGISYVEISDSDKASVRWNSSWYLEMLKCDIALCPQKEWDFPAKSNVKVTTAMSLGLPVIASPIKSYLEIIDNGYNGYISYNLENWAEYLENLKNKDLRRIFALNSFERIKPYRLENIYKEWLNVFKLVSSK